MDPECLRALLEDEISQPAPWPSEPVEYGTARGRALPRRQHVAYAAVWLAILAGLVVSLSVLVPGLSGQGLSSGVICSSTGGENVGCESRRTRKECSTMRPAA